MSEMGDSADLLLLGLPGALAYSILGGRTKCLNVFPALPKSLLLVQTFICTELRGEGHGDEDPLSRHLNQEGFLAENTINNPAGMGQKAFLGRV